MIYLDSAATSKPNSEVLREIMPWFIDTYGNASASHEFGFICSKKIDEVRNIIANKLNIDSTDNIYFCSSSSEANTWFYRTLNDNDIPFTVLSIDHIDSILACEDLKHGYGLFNVDNNGLVDLDKLKVFCEELKYEHGFTDYYFCMNLVNSELGVIQEVTKISNIIHSYGYHIFCDLTQAVCHMDINVKNMGIDACTFGSHKIGGIKGCGVLYSSTIEPNILVYGNQENGKNGGTYNVPAIVSLGYALKLDRNNEYIEEIRDYFEEKLNEIPNCYVLCKDVKRINHISDVCFKDIDSDILQTLLGIEEIYVSKGSACSSYEKKKSHVLEAIGMNDDAYSVLRFSFSEENNKEEIDNVIKAIKMHGELCQLM